jgi:hypothetical protein
MDRSGAAACPSAVRISYFNGGKTAILRSGDYGKTYAISDVTSQFKTNGNGMGR